MPKSLRHPPPAHEAHSMTTRPVQDRTLRSRFEIKYFLHPAVVPEVRRYLNSFVRPDQFTRRPGGSYELSSLYLDTPDFSTYWMAMHGHKHRYKVRIRTYTDDPQAPAYCEIKKRVDRNILKKRGILDREQIPRVLAGHLPHHRSAHGNHFEDVQEFRNLVLTAGLAPTVRVRCRREAYEAPGGEPLRITFDTRIEHTLTFEANLGLRDGNWQQTPVEGTILEVKFNRYFPGWIREMVHMFQLQQVPVSKYCLSVTRAFEERHLPVGPLPRPRRYVGVRGDGNG
jgi:SPX domain protein involved in polyphosphate accumulation